jgi:chemotaxis protein histidine kinase CheA
VNEQTILDEELLGAFVDEAQELLQDVPAGLKQFCENPGDPAPINSVFRAIHTIKGNAGCFGMTGIKEFSHSLEHTLDDIRNGKVSVSDDLRRCLLDGFDLLDEMLNLALNGHTESGLSERESGLLERIRNLVQTSGTTQSPERRILDEMLELAETMERTDASEARSWAEQLSKLVSRIDNETKENTTQVGSAAPVRENAQQNESVTAAASVGSSDASAGQSTDRRESGGSTSAHKRRYLRVKEDCVDTFMDDVSRLFITSERLKDLQSRMAAEWQLNEMVDELRQVNATFSSQANSLQTSVVALRRVPVRGLFSKFPRVARTLATKLGKQLNVHVVGEQLEVDKSLVEDLDAPLMHMIRNVCDHAIEQPSERRERGVSETGNLWLTCELTRTHVVITLRDDGRGIDPDRLLRKAVEKSILTQVQADKLSPEDAIDLVFHPGFSTADQISDVSGRGVGLDVVRSTLRDHRGDIRVASKLGEGTEFVLEIPIRKAVVVVDGLLLRQNDAVYVMPFEFVHAILEFRPDEISTVQGGMLVQVRNETYAAVRLGNLLETETRASSRESTIHGILVSCNERTVCLLVEGIVGQRKVVVNSLADMLSNTRKVSGVAQLGCGQLALVLSPVDLFNWSR